MSRITRKQWKIDVIRVLALISLSVIPNEALSKTSKELIEQDHYLNYIATKKRESISKRKFIKKVSGTETIKVIKKKNDKVMSLLGEVIELLKGE